MIKVYFPGVHVRHSPLEKYDPYEHCVQTDDPLDEKEELVQSRHAENPERLYFPDEHTEQVCVGLVENFPALQLRQEETPLEENVYESDGDEELTPDG